MKKVTMIFALTLGIVGAANAQEVTNAANANYVVSAEKTADTKITFSKSVYDVMDENGDLFDGLTKRIGFDRMIAPHGLEVTYDKTVHVIFPSAVKYVDLGSPNLIAGKADGAENVIRVKSTVKTFREETNMSVITDNGNFYTLAVQ